MVRERPILRAVGRVGAVAAVCGLLLSACATPYAGPDGKYAEPIGDAPVTANPTPYSAALVCLGEWARRNNVRAPRIAVGRISDYTGKEESDGSGRKLTQGASLMAISALAKAGAPLVERYDTSVSELELKYANNKLITDDPNARPGQAPSDYRRILSGQVPGSDFYLVGGITELNFNIRSSGVDAAGGEVKATGIKGQLGARLFIMNIGLDLRLVNTRTLEVVDVVSYQKQIVGHEISAGVFDILHGNSFSVSAGTERTGTASARRARGHRTGRAGDDGQPLWRARTADLPRPEERSARQLYRRRHRRLRPGLQQPGEQQCAKPRRSLSLGRSQRSPRRCCSARPLLAGPPTTTSSTIRTQAATVESSQTLDVVTVDDGVTDTTSSTGNSLTAGSEAGSLDVQTTQSMQGNAPASTTLNVQDGGYSGASSSLTTAATGNAVTASISGGGDMTSTIDQTTGPVSITTDSQINAYSAQTGDVTASSQAVANSAAVGASTGYSGTTVNQTSTAITQSDGGATVHYTPGALTLSATAASNNLTATGTDGAAQDVTATQSMTGERTQAAQFVAVGNGQTVTNAATATANNISASGENNPLNVVTVQDNTGYVRAQAETTSYEFGSSSSLAYGVGNSVMAAEVGSDLTLNNTQTNSGNGVEVIANSTGNNGYDLTSSATAMGNSATGYSCSSCAGTVNVANHQYNSSDVGATSAVSFTSSARSVTGVATAVGNSATFYTTKPTN